MSLRERFRKRVDVAVEKADTSARKPIDENSIHYRIYNWYITHGGRTRHNVNSLCPYMRIVLLWAPLYWLIGYRFHVSRGAALWALWISIIISVNMVWAATKSFELAMLSLAATLGLMASFRLMYLRNPEKFKNRTERFFNWFFLKRYLKVIFPWMIALALVFVGIYIAFGFNGYVFVFWVILALIALMLVAFAILGIGYVLVRTAIMAYGHISDWWYFHRTLPKWQKLTSTSYDQRLSKPVEIRSTTPVKPVRKQKVKGPSLLSLIIAYIMAKERKICPFIQLPNRKQASSDANPIQYGGMEN